MIFLWNKERILLEGMELAKLKISQELGFDKNVVTGEYKLHEGSVIPDFKIDKDILPMSKLDEVEIVIKNVWDYVSNKMNEQLQNING